MHYYYPMVNIVASGSEHEACPVAVCTTWNVEVTVRWGMCRFRISHFRSAFSRRFEEGVVSRQVLARCCQGNHAEQKILG